MQARTTPKPLRAKSVTHVSSINRNPCVQNGPWGVGAPDRIRTCDLCLRRAALYPAELRVLPGDPENEPAGEPASHGFLAEAGAGFNGQLAIGRASRVGGGEVLSRVRAYRIWRSPAPSGLRRVTLGRATGLAHPSDPPLCRGEEPKLSWGAFCGRSPLFPVNPAPRRLYCPASLRTVRLRLGARFGFLAPVSSCMASSCICCISASRVHWREMR